MNRQILWILPACCVLALGCGETPPPVSEANLAKEKVDSFKRLADAMAKDANGAEAKVALEDFRNVPLDVKVNRKEAEEILQVYKARIEGKFQGEVAQQVQMEMAPLQSQLKTAP